MNQTDTTMPYVGTSPGLINHMTQRDKDVVVAHWLGWKHVNLGAPAPGRVPYTYWETPDGRKLYTLPRWNEGLDPIRKHRPIFDRLKATGIDYAWTQDNAVYTVVLHATDEPMTTVAEAHGGTLAMALVEALVRMVADEAAISRA